MVRYAAMTMAHREEAFLSLWLRHYEPMFGRDNLYVLLHGGDDRMADLAQGCRLIFLPRLSVDNTFNDVRFRLLNAYASFLLSQYDGVVAGDVDELVFVDPALGQSLVDFAETHRPKATALWPLGLNILPQKGDPALDLARPVLGQRHHARCDHMYCKPLIVFQDPGWAPGYHSALGQPYLPDGLYMAHLHHCCPDLTIEVAEQRADTLWDNPAIRTGDPFRQAWWGDHRDRDRKYRRLMSRKPVEDFDDAIPGLLETLRARVVPCAWGGPNHHHFACAERPKSVLRLPARFGTLL